MQPAKATSPVRRRPKQLKWHFSLRSRWPLIAPRMGSISQVIRYLRGCYEADNREASIFNLRSDRVEHLEFLSKGGDFIRGLLDVVPADRIKALEAQKAAELYKTERSLVFGAVLLTGSVEGPRGQTPVFAPIFYYPARVEDLGNYAVLRVDWLQQRVNTRLLQAIIGDGEQEFDTLLAQIPNAPFKPTDIYDLIAMLETLVPGIDTAHLRGFANSETALRIAPESNDKGFAAHWGHVMALIPNSPDTRGVLTEMEAVAAAERHSAPIRAVFGGESSRTAREKERRYTLPAQLSPAQEKAVWSAAENTLTVLHGPPGTGKSYTSAVLALDHVARGKSVLIAARTDQALDVIMDKLRQLLGDVSFVLRGGRTGQFTELKGRLEATLASVDERRTFMMDTEWWRIQFSGKKLRERERGLMRRIEAERSWANCDCDRFWGTIRRRLLDWQLRRVEFTSELLEDFHGAAAAQQKEVARFLLERIHARIATAARNHRRELQAFRKALGARTAKRQKEYLAGISRKTLFRTYPLWVTTIADVHDLIPMETEEFDLAIIDEATQCDMASCVPILQRAKRVVVTGDPKQLRHVSFLSRERQRNISERVAETDALAEELDFRGRSLLDLVLENLASDRQLVFLDEHFRSRPELIAFSNEQFYDNKLKLMRRSPESAEPGTSFDRVDGKRNERGVNKEETEAVCQAVSDLIKRERGASRPSSIGVLSPFRDQVEFLERTISKRLDLADIRRHQIRIGTAYAFQGDERDCMFLSLAVNDNSHATAFAYLQRADVFNVSITRARDRQQVFYSFDPRKLDPENLLRKYLEQGSPCTLTVDASVRLNRLQQEIAEALNEKSCSCEFNFAIGGISIDLVVGRNGRWIGLDILCKAPANRSLSLADYRLLDRAGFCVFPVAEREWVTDPAKVLKKILIPLNMGMASKALKE